MKIISIDIGIKNLAYIILENIDNNILKIIDWNILNLCNYIPNCNCCKKQAKYKKDDNYYCNQHTKNTEYKIPKKEFNNLSKENMKTLIEYAKDLNINIENIKSKLEIIKLIEDYKNSSYLEVIETMNANNINLIDIGINLKTELNKLFEKINLKEIDMVIIENQISPLANRMKTIQGMVAQYFINNNLYNIEFISAANKLKLFLENNKKTNYNERKKLSINYTKDILIKKDMNENLKFISEHTKKDDLSDCFLQGIFYLVKFNNLIL